MKSKPPFRILALGDSYTIGTGVDYSDSWPAQLVQALQNQGVAVAQPTIIAKNGWKTGDLLTAIHTANIQLDFDLAAVLIGVNNQYDGDRRDQYAIDFKELIGLAIDSVNGDPTRVLVLSIPDWSVTPFAWGRDRNKISIEIDLFNTINLNESRKTGVHYIDVTMISRTLGDDPDFLAPDGLHPSRKMYAVWVDLILPVLRDAKIDAVVG
jgi:lysophospholipase L1-like esterase